MDNTPEWSDVITTNNTNDDTLWYSTESMSASAFSYQMPVTVKDGAKWFAIPPDRDDEFSFSAKPKNHLSELEELFEI